MTAPSWDLSFAYSGLSGEDYAADIAKINALIAQIAELTPSDITNCQQALSLSEQAGILTQSLSTYANCLASVDAKNQDAALTLSKLSSLGAELSQAIKPFTNQLSTGTDEYFESVLTGSDEVGSFERFRFSLSIEREKKDTLLSVEEEQLLSAMNVDGRSAWGTLYNNITGSMSVTLTLADGTEEAMGLSQAASILYGPDDKRREPAWRAISEAMKSNQVSFAAILNALSGSRLTEYKKRSKKKPVHFLDPALNDSRIVRETLDTMMQVAKDNRHVGQQAGLSMAKLYGTDTLKPWDELASMPALGSGESETYTFDQAISIIKKAFTGVDQEMADFVDMMVENNLIDAAPQPSKRLGAYCTLFAKTRTPMVFMTWGDSMSDVITLAHELGHAFHNWVMRDMPIAQSRYPMTLAETASIFAENIVRDALMAEAKQESDKLMMLWEEAQSSLALMINIPVRFEFEKAFYEQREDGEFSAEKLSQLMAEKWSEWYGDAMAETNDMFWASKLHFSIAGVSFYNYPYLFGYLFSKGVYAQRGVKGDAFYADYKALLRDTGSMSAEDVVEKHLGVDIREPTFWSDSVSQVTEQVNQFNALVNDIK
ncbi:oligoendopeptidase F [Veronia nyctiphanis]|uniref:Oligoendopeptidase F n=1 Tax=Veronia nyctiphanis TaxID=1278244 RepID=A0A4Q0YEC1_9GAMM|nr:M3 family oligoendopeptidase [Veronia nyctiphanis]RXJ68425.1 oligoendopeptidase F [Veronia nyctiphanis]